MHRDLIAMIEHLIQRFDALDQRLDAWEALPLVSVRVKRLGKLLQFRRG
jgi:hypothetical protein